MVHAVYLENEQTQYRNRWVLTKELAEERAAGRPDTSATTRSRRTAWLLGTGVGFGAHSITVLGSAWP
jgi:carotenoid cleavage dioxygenase-like enzyme